ncbi:murein biosynthesis integral membrane protein MurJ [Flavobacterium olei]|uniref:murein biosynthesis integral membrane protein MurJ n=1 Tax=Flavobacterium olei TaxID=1886782 RepID=UPI0032194662
MPESNLKTTTFYLFILRLLRMSLSIVTLPLTAKYFGVSIERDAWILTTTIFSTFGLALWGPLDETFRTKFVFIKEMEGEKAALSKAVSLVGFTVLVTIILSFIVLMFTHPIAHLLDPTGSPKKLSLIVSLMMIMLPTLLINQVTSIGISVLNAYDIYYLPEFAGSVASVCNLLMIIFLAPVIGIYSLAISQYVAILLLLIAVIYYVRKQSFKLRPFWIIYWKDIKVFILFALPFFFPYFAGQINQLAEKLIANSLGDGSVSSLDYARQFSMILQSVISSVLTTVMVPMLAKSFAQKDKDQFAIIVKENFTTCFAIMCLTVPIFIGSATPLIKFFFEHGKVSSDALLVITNLMRYYGLAFIGIILYIIFGLILLASNKGKIYAFWGILAQVIVLVFNISMVNKLGINVFPISVGLGHLLTAFILSYFVMLDGKVLMYLRIAKYISILFIISGVLYFLNLKPVSNVMFIQLLVNAIVLLIMFTIFSKFLDVNIMLYGKKIISKVSRK